MLIAEFVLPRLAGFEHGVGGNEHFAHTGGDSHFERLALSGQPFKKLFQSYKIDKGDSFLSISKESNLDGRQKQTQDDLCPPSPLSDVRLYLGRHPSVNHVGAG